MSIFDLTNLVGVSLGGDNIQGFQTTWDEVLLSIKEMLQDRLTIRDSEELKTVLALYVQDIEQLSEVEKRRWGSWVGNYEIEMLRPPTNDHRHHVRLDRRETG